MRREFYDVRDGRVRFTLDNRSEWSSRDLARFFARGLKAYGIKTPRDIIVVPSPIRSRGCAEIGNGKPGTCRPARPIVIAIASPSRFNLRRLARLFLHELTHTCCYTHEDMPHDVLWSLGSVPKWARVNIRWQGQRGALSRKHR